MTSILVDKNKCCRDRLCIVECPLQILEEDANGFPTLVGENKNRCINCGHCIAVCSSSAISLNSKSAVEYEKILPELIPSKESVAHLIKSRRSIRHYRKTPLDKETIEYLLDIVRWAPSASNRQPVNWIVLTNRKALNKIAEFVVEWMKESGAMPGLLNIWESGYDCIFRGAPNLLIAYAGEKNLNPSIDCSIATTTFELAASAMGVGCCWAGIFMMAANMYSPILEYLEIPEKHKIFTALMLGYPSLKYSRIPDRNSNNVRWLEN